MASGSNGRARKSLISRTLERCVSGLGRSGGGAGGMPSPVAGCFPVYVGPERERFVVRAECAAHRLFRRLLDDAEREYGYASRGPLAVPGCDVDAFLDVLWHMEHGDSDADGGDGREIPMASPICGLRAGGGKARVAGYQILSPRPSSSPALVARRWPGGHEHKEIRHARAGSYS